MRKYNFENAMEMWLRGFDIGREGWNEQALGCYWNELTEEDKLANDYIVFETDEDEFELEHDPNDWEDEEDLYAKYYPEDEDYYDEVYDIIKEEYVERAKQGKAFYINTYEYHCMLVLRTIGVQLNYWEAKEYLEGAEQRHIDFDTKDPYSFSDEEIIEDYIYYK